MLFTLSWRYLKSRPWEIVGILVLHTLATIASLNLPDLNARIIDEGVATGNTSTIWRLGVIMLAIATAQALCTVVATYFGARLAMSLGTWMRASLFRHINSFSSQDMRELTPASLITRSTNDVQQIQMTTLMTFSIIISAPITGIGGVIMSLRQSPQLSLLLLALVPALAIAVGVIMAFLGPLFNTQQERIDHMNLNLREELTGIRVIRAFIRQRFIRERYRDANDQLRSVALRLGTLFALMFPIVTLIVSLTTVGVIWWGGHLINTGDMQIGAMVAFLSYIAMISMAVMMAAMMFVMVPRANVSAHRIAEVLDHAPSITDPAPTELLPSPQGTWTFALEGLSVRYPGAEASVLEDVNITLTPGTTTAVIGATASGKSTLANLLVRAIDPTSGQVSASGTDLRRLALRDVRSHVALVPQHSYLFAGTIASTIAGVKEPDEAQRTRVRLALEGAQASEFVSRFDDGIDHEVEAGGTNFSGGQRQRLAIARALYRHADLYVFDDSFSALDYATDAALRARLPEFTGNAAVFIVAQRIASIRHADQIVVLDGGRIAARGTHSELMKSSDIYRDIAYSQLSEEEAR